MEHNEFWIDVIFFVVTGAVAWHGLTFRDEKGESQWVHLLFGCIALLYALFTLTHNLLGLF